MWIPILLEIENLLTHSSTSLEFRRGEITTITGRNDYDKKKSNGSGKSTMIEGIAIALTGENLRSEVTLSDMVNDNQSSARIRLVLNNSRTGVEMDIRRKLYKGKTPSTLNILINGVEEPISSVKHGNSLILDMLGISKVDLFNYYILSKKKYKSFYYASDQDKKSLIARFSKADIIDEVFTVISEEINSINSELAMLRIDKAAIDGYVQSLETQIAESPTPEQALNKVIELYNNNIADKEEDIKEAEADIDKKKEDIKKYEESIDKFTKEKDLVNKKIEDINKSIKANEDAITKINASLTKYDKSISDYEAKIETTTNEVVKPVEDEIQEFNKLIAEIDVVLSGVVKCPDCKKEFLPTNETGVDIAQARSIKEEAEKEIVRYSKSLEDAQADIAKMKENKQEMANLIKPLRDDLRKCNQLDSDLNSRKRIESASVTRIDGLICVNKEKVSSANKSIKMYEDNIKEYRSAIELINKDIEEAKTQDYNENINILKNKLADKILERDAKDKLIVEKEVSMMNKTSWNSVFKEFYTHLSNKSISSIEDRANKTLDKIKSPIKVSIEGYKVLASGEVRDKIGVSIVRNGRLAGSFGKCSEGEKAYIDIATIIANQDFINMTSPTGGLDLLILDEITESVDDMGVVDLTNMFGNINKTILLITHVDLSSVKRGYHILVRKGVGGVSKIEHIS